MSDSGETDDDRLEQAVTEMQPMPSDGASPTADAREPRPLQAAARRALDEAEARRAAYEAQVAALPRELGGRGGKEPGRYGDWEVKGIATDF